MIIHRVANLFLRIRCSFVDCLIIRRLLRGCNVQPASRPAHGCPNEHHRSPLLGRLYPPVHQIHEGIDAGKDIANQGLDIGCGRARLGTERDSGADGARDPEHRIDVAQRLLEGSHVLPFSSFVEKFRADRVSERAQELQNDQYVGGNVTGILISQRFQRIHDQGISLRDRVDPLGGSDDSLVKDCEGFPMPKTDSVSTMGLMSGDAKRALRSLKWCATRTLTRTPLVVISL